MPTFEKFHCVDAERRVSRESSTETYAEASSLLWPNSWMRREHAEQPTPSYVDAGDVPWTDASVDGHRRYLKKQPIYILSHPDSQYPSRQFVTQGRSGDERQQFFAILLKVPGDEGLLQKQRQVLLVQRREVSCEEVVRTSRPTNKS